jgi:hypothetical protein
MPGGRSSSANSGRRALALWMISGSSASSAPNVAALLHRGTSASPGQRGAECRDGRHAEAGIARHRAAAFRAKRHPGETLTATRRGRTRLRVPKPRECTSAARAGDRCSVAWNSAARGRASRRCRSVEGPHGALADARGVPGARGPGGFETRSSREVGAMGRRLWLRWVGGLGEAGAAVVRKRIADRAVAGR